MAIDDLIEYCQGRGDETLRVVSWYDGDDYGVVYRRDDMNPESVQDRVSAVHEQLTWDWGPPAADELDPLGDELANVQIREQVVILHLPTGDQQGLVLSLDVEAARNLHTFVSECRDELGGEFSIRSARLRQG